MSAAITVARVRRILDKGSPGARAADANRPKPVISVSQVQILLNASQSLASVSAKPLADLLGAPQETARGRFIVRIPTSFMPRGTQPHYLAWTTKDGWQLITWKEPMHSMERSSLERARSDGLVSYRDEEIAWLCDPPHHVQVRYYPNGLHVIELPDIETGAAEWETGRMLIYAPGQGWTQRHN